MSSLLDDPEIRQQAFPVPVALYHRLTEGLRTELLRGTIIEKVSKSPSHQFCADRLRQILVSRMPPELHLRQEGPLTLADSEPEPDLAVVPGPADLYRNEHPATALLVVEIAVSSLNIDRLKAAIYAEAGVEEYWIVCGAERKVEVHRQPKAGVYSSLQTVRTPESLRSLTVPGVEVELAQLFA